MSQAVPGAAGELSNNQAVCDFLDAKNYRRMYCLIRAKVDNMAQSMESGENKIRYYISRILPPESYKDEATGLLEKLSLYQKMD